MSLYQVTCYSGRRKIRLENYADLIISDSDTNIIGIRFGGYPERVTAMTDVIAAGSTVNVLCDKQLLTFTSKKMSNFTRKTSHDGIYAESFMLLKNSDVRIIEKLEENEEKLPRTMYIFCKTDNKNELFEELDRKLSVPLIPEFGGYLIDNLLQKKMLQKLTIYSHNVELAAYKLTVKDDESDVIKILADGLKSGEISIPGDFHGKDIFHDISGFSDYLKQFGTLIAERIKTTFNPLFEPESETFCDRLNMVNQHVKKHASYELFNTQLASAEGLKRGLDKTKLSMIVAECGTGKTKIGAAALFAHQKKKAFNVVISPSHVTDKWVRELNETVPNCYARVIESFQELDKMREIFNKGNKSVYCVISKEKARDGYMKAPSVVWNRVKKAFVCPCCDEIQLMPYFENGEKYMVNADCFFYARETNLNHKCTNKNCQNVLWSAINPDLLDTNKMPLGAASAWVKISDYGFVHREFAWRYLLKPMLPEKYKEDLQRLIDNPNVVMPTKGAYRRYPLSLYIKKKIKKIDGLIIDELHEYSGDSGQGMAMAEIAKSAKKVIAMTATLINGYSKGMFYLLFRLAPRLMKLDEQNYTKSTDFCKQYGVVEKVVTLEKTQINSMSKGQRSSVREKFLPGVSPLVYTRFLLDNAVFLSLTDMGKELPDYEEIPIAVQMTFDVEKEYETLRKELLEIMKRDKRIGQRIMSSYLNLLTAYPDQPYGQPPILNPFNKEEVLVSPQDIGDFNSVLPKDEDVLKLVESKAKAGERVIIFTSWVRLDSREKLKNCCYKRASKLQF